MKINKIAIIICLLIVFSSLVSAFSFADLFKGTIFDFISGNSVVNRGPVTNLNAPSDSEVVAGKKVKFDWQYTDPEGDVQTQYVLEVDNDFTFESPFAYYGLTETVREETIPTGSGTYYWRVQSKDAYGWGDWSETNRFSLDTSEKSCADGTAFWKCSSDKPKYCDAGRLVDKCLTCGCPLSSECQPSNTCVSQTCNDGTLFSTCSVTDKPKYCQLGLLIDMCSFCGCSEGFECTSSGKCAEVPIVIEETEIIVQEEQGVSILGRIVGFFKMLFGKVF